MLRTRFIRSPRRRHSLHVRLSGRRLPHAELQLELCGTACNGNALSHQMPSDSRKSSFAPKRFSTRCIVAHGVRQLTRAGLGASRSRNLGSGIHELQRGVAGIEPTAGAPASRRQAVVPDDRREAAGTPGTDRAHLYSASARPRLPPPACVVRVGAAPLAARMGIYRGVNLRLLVVRRTLLSMRVILR